MLKMREIGVENTLDVTLEVTRECPLRCIFCSAWGGDKYENELSLEEWRRIVDESIDLGATSFIISGGEPFQYDNLKELLTYIHEKDLPITIYSSGNIIKEGELQSFGKREVDTVTKFPSIKVILSLEAEDENLHDYITQRPGSFNNTVDSVKKLLNEDVHVELNFVPTKVNYKELPRLVELSKKLDVKRLSVLRFVPQGRAKKHLQKLKLSQKELIELKNIFDNLDDKDFVRIGAPFNPFMLSKQYKCTAGENRITIKYDGSAVPCEALKFLVEKYNEEVDVRKHTLKEVWYNSNIFNRIRNIKKTLPEECYECKHFSKCGGGCLAQRLLSDGVSQKDPCCLTENIFLLKV